MSRKKYNRVILFSAMLVLLWPAPMMICLRQRHVRSAYGGRAPGRLYTAVAQALPACPPDGREQAGTIELRQPWPVGCLQVGLCAIAHRQDACATRTTTRCSKLLLQRLASPSDALQEG